MSFNFAFNEINSYLLITCDLILNMLKNYFCSQLQEQADLVSKDNKKLLNELDERKIDYDKFKALQSHSAHQQVLLHQLRNRLEEHE